MYGKAKATRPGSTTGGDLKAIFRFHTDIQATGSFRPGEPIRLAVNLRANLPTQNAEVKLFLPEIQALQSKQAGQHSVVYPSGSGLTVDSLSEDSTAGPSSLQPLKKNHP